MNRGNSDSGVCIDHSTVTFRRLTKVLHNTARIFGGGVYSTYSTLIFEGDSLFYKNTAQKGGAILMQSGKLLFYGNTLFTHNSVGGSQIILGKSIGGSILTQAFLTLWKEILSLV